MNLTAILSELYRRLNLPTSPAASETTRLTSFVNLTHRQLLTMPGMDNLRDDTVTFPSVVSQANYGLPPAITRIEAITDRTTQVKLSPIALEDIRASDPGLQQTGPPYCYVNRGWQQVAVQPAAAAQIFTKSTSASDTTQTVFIEGIRTGGVPKSLSVTLTGTTAVSLSATFNDFIEITKFYMSAAAVGTVTLHEVSGAGAELARIQIGQLYARYLGIQLYPTPASVITYYVDYVRALNDMSNNTDEPLLPEDFHWLLVEGALLKEWTKRDDDRRVAAAQDYEKGVSALRYWMHSQADDLPIAGRRAPARSRFGANYPVTRY